VFNQFRRKTKQLLNDPVLRRWLIRRALGRWSDVPNFTLQRPPYLEALPDITLKKPKPAQTYNSVSHELSNESFTLDLPGDTVTVHAGKEVEVYEQSYADIETLLALHRFAWVPLVGADVNTAWVDRLWRTWCTQYNEPDDSWAWHAYTAAERAINILDFAERFGLPGDADQTLSILAKHGPAIASRLEYQGEHNTSNHLSNNGRGLYRLGLALGLSDCTGRGADILLKEAERIFLPSGVLREGSSHYHLLLTRNYADAWLAARKHKRAEERPLREIVKRALSVIPALTLPGRFPLIGDISPDCPPDYLSGLWGACSGWTALLPTGDRVALQELADQAQPTARNELAADGWVRFDYGTWAGLWYIPPDGWAPMPGHAHHDIGSFELHHKGDCVLIDTGRGAYGETGDAAYYRSGQAHNTVLIDGRDPYPPNKPYYTDAFRQDICGKSPGVVFTDHEIGITHGGNSLYRGVKTVARSWNFKDSGFELHDEIKGSRQSTVTRILHTELPVKQTNEGATISGQSATYTLRTDRPLTLEPATAWQAYGSGNPATAIIIESRESLPCTLKLNVDAKI
jgi:hypothetical protein